MPNKVIIITGPTASGKTETALDVAEEIGAEIISCDSVQVYKGMDIGSAKPHVSERRGLRHHLMDVAEVSEHFNVQEYVLKARAAFDEIRARGKRVVVAGGSGFYLKAWFSAVTDEISVSEDIRAQCRRIEERGGAPALAEKLLSLDPDAGKFVDMMNPRRTFRAIERVMASGKKVSEILSEFKKLPCPMGEFERDLRIIDRPDSEMDPRIAERTRKMINSGLVDETRKLISQGILQNPSAKNSIGYRETIAWLSAGSQDEGALFSDIVKSTLSLAKKQRKYFKNSLTE